MVYIIKVNNKIKAVAKSAQHKEYTVADLKRKHKDAKVTVEKV
jgi:hypothetical protein